MRLKIFGSGHACSPASLWLLRIFCDQGIKTQWKPLSARMAIAVATCLLFCSLASFGETAERRRKHWNEAQIEQADPNAKEVGVFPDSLNGT